MVDDDDEEDGSSASTYEEHETIVDTLKPYDGHDATQDGHEGYAHDVHHDTHAHDAHAQDARRRQAFVRLQRIEAVFRSLKDRIVLHKERSLDAYADDIRSGTHAAYLKGVVALEHERNHSLLIAKKR